MNYAEFISKAANKEVVMLALQSHGAEEDYQLTASVVTELVTKHGFSHIFFLSSWYDSHFANSTPIMSSTLVETTKKFLYKSYSKSARFNEMWDKIESIARIENLVKVRGIEIPMGGDASTSNMLIEIESFISNESKPEVVEKAWSNFKFIASQALELKSTSMTKIKHRDFNICLGYLKELSKKKQRHFSILIDNLHARFLTTNNQYWRRQKQIFDNFEYESASFEGSEKIIIIGHATHLVPRSKSFGEYIKMKYKDKSFSTLFTAQLGCYLDTENGIIRNLTQNNIDSFESSIVSSTDNINFFDRGKVIKLLKDKKRHNLFIKISNYASSYSITELMVNNKNIDVAIVFDRVNPVVHQ